MHARAAAPSRARTARRLAVAAALAALVACGRSSPPDGAAPSRAAASSSATFEEACGAIPAPPPPPVLADPGCLAWALPRMDDGSSAPVALPSTFDFFGGAFGAVYVNNNGDVSFGRGLRSAYWPFGTLPTTPPFIAPFLGDVDTRPAGSQPVTYGDVAFGGRPGLCVDWVGVGYYSQHTDRLDSFQLLLVDRSDVAPGDFDFLMNYGTIAWDKGDYVPSSAGAGYAPGELDPTTGFELPGSLVPGAFLDANADTGLARTSRNSLVPGRHLFEVRGGLAPLGGNVAGRVDAAGVPLAGAPVQVCPVGGDACVVTATNDAGLYLAAAVAEGDHVVTAFPPAGSALAPRAALPVHVAASGVTRVDVSLAPPLPRPPTASLGPSTAGCGGVPVVFWNDPSALEVQACAGGTGTFAVVQGAATLATGAMSEVGPGAYAATVPALQPAAGLATVVATVDCASETDGATFDVYLSPAWLVRTPAGAPVAGATVTLFRSDGSAGPFEAVTDGSAALSPMNRSSPALTDASGRFGWDLVAGHYVARAQRDGCTSEGGAPYAESTAFAVPGAPQALELRLDCPVADTTPPALSGVPSSFTVEAAGPAGAIVAWAPPAAVDAVDGVVAVACAPSSGSTFPLGATAVTCSAADAHGNVASASFVVTVADRTAPALSGVPSSFTVEAAGPAGAIVAWGPPAAVDAVDGVVAVACAPSSGSTFPLGTTAVTCSAADAHGNVASASFVVTVADRTAPAVARPADVVVDATSSAGAAVTFGATATDAVDPAPAVTCAPASGSVFPLGTTAVACTARDASGNVSAPVSFLVTVRASAAYSSVAIGPVAMEGALKLSAGTVVKVGYAVAMPLSPHPADTVQLRGATITFAATCASKADGPGGNIVVAVPDGSYAFRANETAWFPTADAASALSFQATTTIPALCGAGQVSLKSGGTFRAGLTWVQKSTRVDVRWHYSANGSKGTWSPARQAVPY